MNVNPFFRVIDLITSPIRRLFNLVARVTPGLNKLPSLSVPMLAAVVAWFVLMIIYAVAVISMWRAGALYQQRDQLVWLLLFLLVLVITVIVYFLVKFWLVKEESRFPNIDQIWETAMEQCQQQGISVRQIPIFLILGARDQQQATNLMKASQIPMSIAVPKQQDTDLAFFANESSAFLFLNGCSCISGLSMPSLLSPVSSPAPVESGSALAGTIDASAFAKLAGGMSANSPASPAAGGTLTQGAMQASPLEAPAYPMASPDAGRTMVLPEGQQFEDFLKPTGDQMEAPGRLGAVAAANLSSQEVFERQEKLSYVCQLVQKVRQPVCPINGVLTLLPFELIESASGQVQTAVQKDLRVLREELMVRCSNTVLVTQMDKEEGFQELVKRVGEQECRDSRFGRGSDLWNAPSSDRLRSIAAHAVGAFEDWIYLLFQRENALQQRYNSRLLGLLCRVRGKFAENLPVVLGRGFGFDPNTEPELADEQFLFGGCYFAGTGSDPERYAFVKSVFSKILQHEGELEWSPRARLRESQYQIVASLFALLGGVSLLATLGLLAWKFVAASE